VAHGLAALGEGEGPVHVLHEFVPCAKGPSAEELAR